MKILIIDDDPNSQEVLTDILTFSDIEVEVASSGEQGVSLVTDNKYDGVVIDLKLPGMDGWEALSAIKAVKPVPCVAITVYDNANVQAEAEKAGFNGYIAKPVNELTFTQTLVELIS